MAPQQNTFSVISNGVPRAGGAPSKPPMTSKQAQKLYKQANKGPRMSKAEQLKWEKERQEEIRKELEKERAAVKAKVARERKKAKEDEARQSRRQAGQPLIDCRPSQDTIARFVCGNGTNKKRDSSGEQILKAKEQFIQGPEPKPQLTALHAAPAENNQSTSPEHKFTDTSMPPPPQLSQRPRSSSPFQSPRPSQHKAAQVVSMPPPPAPKTDSSIKALRPPPVFKPPVIAPNHGRSAAPMVTGPPLKPPPKSKPKPFMMPKVLLPSLLSAQKRPIKQETKKQMSVDQKQTNEESSEGRPFEKEVVEQRREEQNQPGQGQVQKQAAQKPFDQRPFDQEHPRQKLMPERFRMPPPPKPSPEMPPPSLSQSQMPAPQTPLRKLLEQVPPPSTQAIIQDCFDDFFPTASQLALELEDDKLDDASQRSVSRPSKEGHSIKVVHNGHQQFSGHPGARYTSVHQDLGLRSVHHLKKPGAGHHPGSKNTNSIHPPVSVHVDKPNASNKAGGTSTAKQQGTTDTLRHEPWNSRPPIKSVRPASTKMIPTRNRQLMEACNTKFLQKRRPSADKPKAVDCKNRILQEISGNRAPAPKPSAAAKPGDQFGDFFPLICTQDLMMSSQEVLEIESPANMNSQRSSGALASHPSPLIEMDLADIDWDDDLDDF